MYCLLHKTKTTLTKSAAFCTLAISGVSLHALISTFLVFKLNRICSCKCSTTGVKIFNQFSFNGVYLCAGTGIFLISSLLSEVLLVRLLFGCDLVLVLPSMPLCVSTSMAMSPVELARRFRDFFGSNCSVLMLTSISAGFLVRNVYFRDCTC